MDLDVVADTRKIVRELLPAVSSNLCLVGLQRLGTGPISRCVRSFHYGHCNADDHQDRGDHSEGHQNPVKPRHDDRLREPTKPSAAH
jgi:hypothetical protein